MRRVAIVGLVWLVASVANAQQPSAGVSGPAPAPANPAPVGGASICSLMSKSGIETPLAGFNPAATSVALPVPQVAADASMVVCNRATIVPEVTDYRVLTDMRLPLAIKSGGKTLFLGAKQGQIQFGIPDGDATPAEIEALRTRRDEMQTAMTKAAGK